MRLADRYQIVRRVGEGGGGGVFLVRDRLADGAQVVLKRLHAHAQAGVAQWLVNEFQVLAQLGLPTVASVFDFGLAEADATDPGGPFFTRAFVDGAPLDVALGAPESLDAARVVALVSSAAETLAALHRVGVVHGDLKPANLIVPENGRQVILIDFGLAHGALGAADRVRGGTLAFLPPERRIALASGESLAPDPRADVYALCATLLQLLGAPDPESEPPASVAGRTELRALFEIARRGCAVDPDRRYATADDVLVAITGGRAVARTIPNRVVLRPEGREAELGALLEHIARRLVRREGGAASVLIVGDEGSGRSTLLRELTWRAQLRGVQVLAVPGAPGDGPMRTLRAGAEILSGTTFEPSGPDALVAAFRRAARRTPVLVVADDLDQADPAVAAELRSLAYGCEKDEPLLVLAASTNEASAHGFSPAAQLALGPLDETAVTALCAQILGPVEPGVAAAVQTKAGGLPLGVSELLLALAGVGGVTVADVERTQVSTRTRDIALRRVNTLGAPERETLAAIVALGSAADAALVAQVTGDAEALERARISGMVSVRADGRVHLAQAALADAVVDALPASSRAAIFERTATLLDDDRRPAALRTAAWVRAGNAGRALAHLEPAVAELRAQGLPLAAASLVADLRRLDATSDSPSLCFLEADLRHAGGDHAESARIAAMVVDDPDPSLARRARLLAGRALVQVGRTDDAVAYLRSGADFAADGDSAGEFHRELANVEFRGGHYAEAAARCEQALGRATRPVVRAPLLALWGLSVSYLGEQTRAIELLEQALATFVQSDDVREQARVLAYLAIARDRAGDLAEARALYERALDRARSAGDVGQMASARLNLGTLLDRLGDLAASLEHFEAASRLAQRAGKPDTALVARLNTAQDLMALGSYPRARAEVESVLADARTLGYREIGAHATALLGVARARLGEVDAGLGLIFEASEQFAAMGQSTAVADMAFEVAAVLLDRGALGDAQRAAERLTSARDAVPDLGPRAARARMLEARVVFSRGDARGAQKLLGEAIELAERVHDWDSLSHALAVRAQTHQATGAEIHARRDRERALEVLETTAANLPPDLRSAFWSVPERGNLRSEGSSPSPRDARASVSFMPLTGALAGNAPTIIANDQRLMLLLELSRRVGEETALERVLDLAVRSAVELTNAERGAILLLEADGALAVRASVGTSGGPGLDETFSRSIAETALIDGEVIATHNARGDSRFADFRSVHELAIGAVAAIPMRVRGRTLGVLYLENRARRGLWSPSDVVLVKAFAEQAAVAVDHARLIGELEDRGRQLETANREIESLLAARTMELEDARRSLARANEALRSRFALQGVVGNSAAMRTVAAVVERVRDADVPVVIEGESGTGKEVIARAIHFSGARAKGPFVVVHCGAIPETLLESELFGHVRGAFTGADRDRKGLLASASGGTLMLDEVADMPMKMQVELLRVLQDRKVRRVGSEVEEDVDLRVIAAVNRPLRDLVAEGRFREDLYYRLSVVSLRLPPLRERLDDLPALANHFLTRFAEEQGITRKRLAAESVVRLTRGRWPGNVRQLRHVLESAAVMADNDVIEADQLQFDTTDAAAIAPSTAPSAPPPAGSPRSARKTAERQRIVEALEQANWNKVRAAEILKMPRRTLYRRLEEFGLLD